ncbi:MAG: haloacid dehalogenase [Paracoccaceae bacterium]|nr:MAG: HAD family hydrolase [Alphaproteobacteria bacterium]GIX15236.1 MAG: haloacid dehalogenase [Paracoccaceae bacterium]
MNGPRLVIFDFDGTLVDSRRPILAAMRAAFAALGEAAPPEAEILAIVGLSLPQAFATLRPGLPAEAIARLARAYRDAFAARHRQGALAADAPLFPGARAALERLSADPATLIGIATGKGRRGLDQMLALHGLGHHFATLQTADLHPSKPHPAMLHAALAETGVEPAAAVMVGDTEFDIAMARAAGLRSVGVTWGYHPPSRLRAAGADIVVDSFAALEAVLEEAA